MGVEWHHVGRSGIYCVIMARFAHEAAKMYKAAPEELRIITGYVKPRGEKLSPAQLQINNYIGEQRGIYIIIHMNSTRVKFLQDELRMLSATLNVTSKYSQIASTS